MHDLKKHFPTNSIKQDVERKYSPIFNAAVRCYIARQWFDCSSLQLTN